MRCELCGKTAGLGRFHILRQGLYPLMMFHDCNVLIAGWFCCHEKYHPLGGDEPESQRIINRLKELRGETYRDDLLTLDAIQPKLTMFQLHLYEKAFEIGADA